MELLASRTRFGHSFCTLTLGSKPASWPACNHRRQPQPMAAAQAGFANVSAYRKEARHVDSALVVVNALACWMRQGPATTNMAYVGTAAIFATRSIEHATKSPLDGATTPVRTIIARSRADSNP